MRRSKRWFIILAFMGTLLSPAFSGSGNRFVWMQLKHDGAWDPYENVSTPIFDMMKTMTNISFAPARVVVGLNDAALFENSFLVVKGNSALRFSSTEKNNLKKYIERGGLVFFDDTLADSRGGFSNSVRSLMQELFPALPLHPLPADHAVFRSFFLVKNPAGRRISEKYMEGLDLPASAGGQSRTAVLLCSNDLLGSWAKDVLGAYLSLCDPGGEAQRWDSHKLTLNIIYFSLTGTYKKDAVHQPFIEQKLGS